MRYKSIDEQNRIFISILKENKDLMLILEYISELKLPIFILLLVQSFRQFGITMIISH